ALLSDMGRVRKNNEDAVGEDRDMGLLVLADGMGGYNAGEVASGIATKTIPEVVRREWKSLAGPSPAKDGPSPHTLLLKKAVEEAHQTIYQAAQSQPQCAGMGTTVVVVLLHDDRMSIAHVGDSRLYRYRFSQLKQVTRDHSLQEEMIAKGHYTREEAAMMVRKNIVTRALGVESDVNVELNESPVEIGDTLLLCSDGLTDMVSDEQIGVILRRNGDDLQGAARDLVQQALQGGGKDNVSVILARVDQSFARGRPWYRHLLDWF
ncbi:MAG: Stp1/IreP family PP2C-type Ser/Thr phosphatase, partial [Panacagrimonas sp.]